MVRRWRDDVDACGCGMVRQMVVEAGDGRVHLQEVLADIEAELQDKLQRHPERLPLEELELQGPLFIVGRETSLPSGAVDLVGIARNGAILVTRASLARSSRRSSLGRGGRASRPPR